MTAPRWCAAADTGAALLWRIKADLWLPLLRLESVEASWFEVAAGDLLRALTGVGDTITYWVDEAWNFCVRIGEELYRCAVDLVEKAVAFVVGWFLEKLRLGFEQIIEWLGYVRAGIQVGVEWAGDPTTA